MPFNADERLANADWTKSSWDVPWVTTEEELRQFVQAQGFTVDEFKELPVYVANQDREPFNQL